MDHKSNAHNQQLERINHFMTFNHVPHYMQIAIKQYYEYKWSRPDTDLPVSDLPSILKIRLKVLLNREALSSVPVFRELPPDCMIALTQHVKSMTVFPTEFSTHQGQKNSVLYIIRHGRMKLTRHPTDVVKQTNARDRWKALLHRWSQNNRARQASLANLALTAYRDNFLLTAERRNDDIFVAELTRGNFYGANSLLPYEAPEDFSCSAIVFSEVLMLDTKSQALKMILKEYPIMRSKVTKFAEKRRKKIRRDIEEDHGIRRSNTLFGGAKHKYDHGPATDTDDDDDTDNDTHSSPVRNSDKGVYSTTQKPAAAPTAFTQSGAEKEGSTGAEGVEKKTKGSAYAVSASAADPEAAQVSTLQDSSDADDEEEEDEGGTSLGMGALLRGIAGRARDQRRMSAASAVQGQPSRRSSLAQSLAVSEQSATLQDIHRVEKSIEAIRQIQEAQFQSLTEKLEEILSNMYV